MNVSKRSYRVDCFYVILILFIIVTGSVYGEQVLLLKLKKSNHSLGKTSADKHRLTGLSKVDNRLSRFNAHSVSAIADFDGQYLNEPAAIELSKWIKISIPDSVDLEKAIQELQTLHDLDVVKKNQTLHLHYTPNDPLTPSQWALEKIKAHSAWEIQRGDKNVLVAVIDTGVDYMHPDLAENIWLNAGEDLNGNGKIDTFDLNEIDDDGNGFVDDMVGWDFTDAPNYPDGGDYLDRDNDPMDEHPSSHGTAVSGIIAAVANNGKGIAGLAHHCRVMCLRAFTAQGLGEEDDAASAILYAIENGANVINMSWGDDFVTQLLDDVLKYAASKDVVLVASSGNSGNDVIHYPSAFEHTISVGATDENDVKTGFSNYGPTVDILAPGAAIKSLKTDAGYDSSYNGTSFAAPFVSAAAALVISQDPSLIANAVRGILLTNADDLGSQGWDSYYGTGRLNVEKALVQFSPTLAQITSPVIDEGFSDKDIPIVGSAWSPTFKSYQLSYGIGENPKEWIHITKNKSMVMDDLLGIWQHLPEEEGTYIIRLIVKNRDGKESISTTRIFIDTSPPLISDVELLPMVDGDHYSTLVKFNTDDLCKAKILYRPIGSDDSFQVIPVPYRTTEHSLNISQKQLTGSFEIKLRAKNSVGNISEDDNNGQYYQLDLNQPPINVVLYTPIDWQLPYGYLYPSNRDLDHNGHPEIVLNIPEDGRLDLTRFYEFDGTQFNEVFATDRPIIPRDLADIDHDNKFEFLGGFGYNSFLYASPDSTQYPSDLSYMWEGDGSKGYWASRLADMDQDGQMEVIMRVIQSGDEDRLDHYEVWEKNLQNQFVSVASLPNPTKGENFNGIPHCQVGDLDQDNQHEILLGDSDGDIYIYENRTNDGYVSTWSDSLPLKDTIDYLQTGDFDGDGVLEFVAGCHSSAEQFNSEHSYDSRHWLYRIYDNIGDNQFIVKDEWRFFGFESTRDFHSGVSSGDIDQDGKDEILICVFPDFYIVEHSQEQGYDITYHHSPVQINRPIVTDINKDGLNEFWLGDGRQVRAFVRVGSSTGPAAPVGVKAFPMDENRINLSWYSVPGASAYRIYRGTDLGHLKLLTLVQTTLFIDSDVVTGQKYWYGIVAVDPTKTPNMSTISGIVSAKPGARPFLQGVQVETQKSIRLQFSEQLDESIKNVSNYSVSPTPGEITSAAHDESGKSVVLSFDKAFTEQEEYTVFVSHLYDMDHTPFDTTRNFVNFTISLPELPPYLVEARLVESDKLELVFNENMNLNSLLNPENYDMGENIVIKRVSHIADKQDRVFLRLSSSKGFGALGKTYYIRVENVKNKNGVSIRKGRGDYLKLIFSKVKLDNVFTYPNPYRSGIGDEQITFANLTPEAEIKIMTLSGQTIRTIYEDNGDGGVKWDVRDKQGNFVASGIYLYRVQAGDQTVYGKLAIVR